MSYENLISYNLFLQLSIIIIISIKGGCSHNKQAFAPFDTFSFALFGTFSSQSIYVHKSTFPKEVTISGNYNRKFVNISMQVIYLYIGQSHLDCYSCYGISTNSQCRSLHRPFARQPLPQQHPPCWSTASFEASLITLPSSRVKQYSGSRIPYSVKLTRLNLSFHL